MLVKLCILSADSSFSASVARLFRRADFSTFSRMVEVLSLTSDFRSCKKRVVKGGTKSQFPA